MLVSVLTLIIFFYQTSLMREQSRLSVLPRLSFETNEVPRDSIFEWVYYLNNKGIGPAILEKLVIVQDGKEYPMRFRDFFDEMYPEHTKYGKFVQTYNLSYGSTLVAGETRRLCTYHIPMRNLDKLMKYIGLTTENKELPFKIVVDYKSIYNDAWRLDSEEIGHPKPL